MEFLKSIKSHGMLLLLIAAWFGVALFVSDQDDQAVPEVNEIYTFLQAPTKGRQFWAMNTNTSNNTNGSVTGNQSITANETITVDTVYSAGTFTFDSAGTMTVADGVTVTFASDAVVDITAETTFAGTGTIIFESGSSGTWIVRVIFETTTVTMTGSTFSVADTVFSATTYECTSTTFTTANASTMQLRAANTTFGNSSIAGDGAVTANAASVVITLQDAANMSAPLTLATPTTLPVSKAHRGMLTTITGATTSVCASTTASVTAASGSATHANLACTLTGTSYSGEITTLTYVSGAFSQYINVDGSGLPLLSTSVTGLELPTIEVTNTGSGAFTQELLHYSATSCTTSFAATSWDTCASGYTCSITGAASGTDCAVYFNQVLTTTSSDDSNDGLYALFALFAIPVALLVGLAIMKLCKPKPKAPVVTEYVEEYPVYPAYPYAGVAPAAYPTVATTGYDVTMPVPPSSLY